MNVVRTFQIVADTVFEIRRGAETAEREIMRRALVLLALSIAVVTGRALTLYTIYAIAGYYYLAERAKQVEEKIKH